MTTTVDTYVIPGDNTSQVGADSVQTILLNLLVICDHKVSGIRLQFHATGCEKPKS